MAKCHAASEFFSNPRFRLCAETSVIEKNLTWFGFIIRHSIIEEWIVRLVIRAAILVRICAIVYRRQSWLSESKDTRGYVIAAPNCLSHETEFLIGDLAFQLVVSVMLRCKKKVGRKDKLPLAPRHLQCRTRRFRSGTGHYHSCPRKNKR